MFKSKSNINSITNEYIYSLGLIEDMGELKLNSDLNDS